MYFQLFSLSLIWVFWTVLRRFLASSPLDNIPGPPSTSFWKGVFPDVFNPRAWQFHEHLAQNYPGIARISAYFGDKQLFVFDPKALYQIVVKDQNIYESSRPFIRGNTLLFGSGLLSTIGDEHKKQRKIMMPVFSVPHLRNLVPTLYDITHKLGDAVMSQLDGGPAEIDMFHWLTRTALEMIGQTGLGYSFDSLTDAPAHPYADSIKELVPLSFSLFTARTYIVPWAIYIGPPAFRRFFVDILPWKTLHKARDLVDLMHKTSVDIYQEKKRALDSGDQHIAHQIAEGSDIISILMRENLRASEADRLSEAEIIGQVRSTLIFAAMDTTANATSRILHLLATHPDVQEKLRHEITTARENNDDLQYDDLAALPFLEAVCRETLRMYPPVSQVVKTANQDISLPLSSPITGVDGREISEVLVPQNTNVIVSILSANRNPQIWGSDAHEWKPQRWLSDLPGSVAKAPNAGIYSHMLTFLGGSRGCIGMKLAQLDIKILLSVLLERFRFSLAKEPVFWEMTFIATPSVDNPRGPRLPLNVERVER
ncbi:cytochrome P450 [Mycena floridula]|nr:cytochrome P450 [Mycena floridula]